MKSPLIPSPFLMAKVHGGVENIWFEQSALALAVTALISEVKNLSTHGVDQTGRSLLFMPAQYYRYYSDADLGAIVASIQSMPPVDKRTSPRRILLVGQILFLLDNFGKSPAEIIDHRSVPPQPPQDGVSPEYGEFLVTVGTCKNCYGENLAGGEVGPDDPFAPNLTPGGELAGWTEEYFFILICDKIHIVDKNGIGGMLLLSSLLPLLT